MATRDFAKRMFDSPWHNFEDSNADEELPNYYAAIGEFGEAIRLWSSEIQKDPGCPLFRYERSVLYSRTGQFQYAERDIETLEDDQFSYIAKAFHHFWREQPGLVREYHDKLRSLKNVHGSFLVYTHCMLDELDQSLERYVKAVSFRPISFIDFGPLRVMCRAKLPVSLIERTEQHPIFAGLLAKQGITAGRQAELMERLNEIATITGITVASDEPLPAGRPP